MKLIINKTMWGALAMLWLVCSCSTTSNYYSHNEFNKRKYTKHSKAGFAAVKKLKKPEEKREELAATKQAIKQVAATKYETAVAASGQKSTMFVASAGEEILIAKKKIADKQQEHAVSAELSVAEKIIAKKIERKWSKHQEKKRNDEEEDFFASVIYTILFSLLLGGLGATMSSGQNWFGSNNTALNMILGFIIGILFFLLVWGILIAVLTA